MPRQSCAANLASSLHCVLHEGLHAQGREPTPPAHAVELHSPSPSCCAQLVERVVAGLTAKFNRAEASPTLGVVRLSGLVHAADRVAFREVARQLCTCAARTLARNPKAYEP